MARGQKIKKVVIACDSFKGSLTSAQVAAAAAAGIHDVDSGILTVELPVADGGEGTTDALLAALGGCYIACEVHDPLMRTIKSHFGVAKIGNALTAIIDMASVSGITLLSPEERNPAITTTYGTGEMMLRAWSEGCRRFIIGIGGSATNDGGTGMLSALGVRFLNADGNLLPQGGLALSNLSRIDTSMARKDILGADITVISDVTNPLCGPEGASYVYAPQKGADSDMVAQLDDALMNYAQVIEATVGRNVAEIPGAGAAGGLGAGFLAFSSCRLTRGIDAILDIIDFNSIVSNADLVITGEGRIDRQTLFGKVPSGVLARASELGVPVVAIAGAVADHNDIAKAPFAGIYPIANGDLNLEYAMQPAVAAENVRHTCAQIIKRYNLGK